MTAMAAAQSDQTFFSSDFWNLDRWWCGYSTNGNKDLILSDDDLHEQFSNSVVLSTTTSKCSNSVMVHPSATHWGELSHTQTFDYHNNHDGGSHYSFQSAPLPRRRTKNSSLLASAASFVSRHSRKSSTSTTATTAKAPKFYIPENILIRDASIENYDDVMRLENDDNATTATTQSKKDSVEARLQRLRKDACMEQLSLVSRQQQQQHSNSNSNSSSNSNATTTTTEKKRREEPSVTTARSIPRLPSRKPQELKSTRSQESSSTASAAFSSEQPPNEKKPPTKEQHDDNDVGKENQQDEKDKDIKEEQAEDIALTLKLTKLRKRACLSELVRNHRAYQKELERIAARHAKLKEQVKRVKRRVLRQLIQLLQEKEQQRQQAMDRQIQQTCLHKETVLAQLVRQHQQRLAQQQAIWDAQYQAAASCKETVLIQLRHYLRWKFVQDQFDAMTDPQQARCARAARASMDQIMLELPDVVQQYQRTRLERQARYASVLDDIPQQARLIQVQRKLRPVRDECLAELMEWSQQMVELQQKVLEAEKKARAKEEHRMVALKLLEAHRIMQEQNEFEGGISLYPLATIEEDEDDYYSFSEDDEEDSNSMLDRTPESMDMMDDAMKDQKPHKDETSSFFSFFLDSNKSLVDKTPESMDETTVDNPPHTQEKPKEESSFLSYLLWT